MIQFIANNWPPSLLGYDSLSLHIVAGDMYDLFFKFNLHRTYIIFPFSNMRLYLYFADSFMTECVS